MCRVLIWFFKALLNNDLDKVLIGPCLGLQCSETLSGASGLANTNRRQRLRILLNFGEKDHDRIRCHLQINKKVKCVFFFMLWCKNLPGCWNQRNNQDINLQLYPNLTVMKSAMKTQASLRPNYSFLRALHWWREGTEKFRGWMKKSLETGNQHEMKWSHSQRNT